jgi:hypothetical protein
VLLDELLKSFHIEKVITSEPIETKEVTSFLLTKKIEELKLK